MDLDDDFLNELLGALGAHLAAADAPCAIVVVGGANLAIRQLVERTTKDVDVIARAVEDASGMHLVPPEPFPAALQKAVARVARDFGLADDWLNAVVGSQWRAGLPPDLESDVSWREYGALQVGYVGRRTLVALKFFAVVDQGPASIHWQDLLRLSPSDEELDVAVEWVGGQDAGVHFGNFVEQARDGIRRELGRR